MSKKEKKYRPKAKIIVGNLDVSKCNSSIEISVDVKASHLSFKERLWYIIPERFQAYLNDLYDPFLVALLPIALKTNSDLILRGEVTEYLLNNTRQIIEIFSNWDASIEDIQIQPDSVTQGRGEPEAVASFFTGGVDSFHTLLKNLNRYENEFRINHIIYVNGFDIKLSNNELYKTVRKVINSVADELNIEPIFIDTNLRKLTAKYVDWGKDHHGAALASSALLLSNYLKTVFIPASSPFYNLRPWGSHPLLDPLWSNESLHFFHDGNESSRAQKIQREISKSKIALKYLRVCWENPDNRYNCGVCGKCIRTKISLKTAGVLEQCQTLSNEIDTDVYKKILLKSDVERKMLKNNIYLADNISPDYKRELQDIQKWTEKERQKWGFRVKNRVKMLSSILRKKL